MLNCSHCGASLEILQSGVAIACTCAATQQEELLQNQRRHAWHADREKAIAAERERKQRTRR